MAANTLAYGFTAYRHLAGQRLSGIGTEVTFDMIRQSAEEHSRMLRALFSGGIEITTLYQKRQYLSALGTLQPLDEHGVPELVREEGYFDVAFPMQRGGTAFGDTITARELMTFEEANRRMIAALRRDADWVKRHFLASIFTNVDWTYADPEHGSLTIKPIANNDGVNYPIVGGSTEDSQHFLAQASAIDDSNNPFDNIYAQLKKHPSNTGPYVAFIPTNLVATTTALTNFVAVQDVDIQAGSASDQIAVSSSGKEVIRSFGDEVLGKTDGMWIVEWRSLPDDFIIAHAQGAGAIVAQRELPAAALTGFFVRAGSGDGNLSQTNLYRYAGYGIWNRINCIAQRIGNASYAIPTGYTQPLPV